MRKAYSADDWVTVSCFVKQFRGKYAIIEAYDNEAEVFATLKIPRVCFRIKKDPTGNVCQVTRQVYKLYHMEHFENVEV